MGINGQPKIIDLTKQFGTVEKLTEARVNCSLEEKVIHAFLLLSLFSRSPSLFRIYTCTTFWCCIRDEHWSSPIVLIVSNVCNRSLTFWKEIRCHCTRKWSKSNVWRTWKNSPVGRKALRFAQTWLFTERNRFWKWVIDCHGCRRTWSGYSEHQTHHSLSSSALDRGNASQTLHQ